MAVTHTNFIGSCFDKFTGEKFLRAGVYSGTKAQGSYAEMEVDKGIPGRGWLEKGLLKVGKVTKLHGGQFPGQRALKGSSGLGSLWPGFSYCYQMWNEILQRYAKQAGAKWLKNLLVWPL